MGILKNNQKTAIRYECGEIILYEIDEIQKEELWQREKLLNMSRTIKNGIFEVRKSNYSEQEKKVFEERLFREYLLCRILEYRLYINTLTSEELKELEQLVAIADQTLSSGGYFILN